MRLKWMGPWSRCLNRVGQPPRGTFTTAAAQVAEYASKKPTPVPWVFSERKDGWRSLKNPWGFKPSFNNGDGDCSEISERFRFKTDSSQFATERICQRKILPSAGFTSASWAEVMSVFQEFDGLHGLVVLKLEGQQFGKTARRSRLRWASAVGWVSLRKLRNWPSFCNKRCPSATPNVFATLTLGGVGVVPRLFLSGKDGFPQHDPEKGPQMDFFSWWRIPNTSRKMTVWGRKNSDVSKSRWDAEVLGR